MGGGTEVVTAHLCVMGRARNWSCWRRSVLRREVTAASGRFPGIAQPAAPSGLLGDDLADAEPAVARLADAGIANEADAAVEHDQVRFAAARSVLVAIAL